MRKPAWTIADLKLGMRPLEERLTMHWLCEEGLLDITRQRFAAPVYRLTEAGRARVARAKTEAASERRAARLDEPTVFRDRLWSLLRIRQALTANEAAAVLIDAGDDVDRAERHARELLQHWHAVAPSAIAVSARKIAGRSRYVLLRDQVTPPTAHGIGGGR